MSSVLIVGAGAMAVMFAARLSAADIEVSLLDDWEEGIWAISKRGIHFIDQRGKDHHFKVKTFSGLKKIPPHDMTLVLVKSWQTEVMAKRLAEYVDDPGIVITLQNGLGNDLILKHSLGVKNVLSGVTTLGATSTGIGESKFGGDGKVILPSINYGIRAAEIFHKAEITTDNVDDIRTIIWNKLVINSSINPLTALLDIPNGGIIKAPEIKELAGQVAVETANVARLVEEVEIESPAEEVWRVAEMTSGNISSMLQDVRRGAPTEIEAISGEIMRLGIMNDIPVPLNTTLWQLIRTKIDTQTKVI
ncbi:MAG: 2-dehydropantoate 2-reductase [Anaerolineales bacterium]|nr:2-dehydropantoate 2-reductase [Anaerolineales bacterium]